ncbi:MAG: DUF4252 domain-containing protein [Bacteroidales bacterium]
MKKSLLIFAVLLFCMSVKAQTSPVDELFDKYADKEGFTSVFISGKMFGMLAQLQPADSDKPNNFPKISSIRILTEDSLNLPKVNFYNELSKKLDFSAYEELMVVKEQQEVTKFLIRKSGNTISEFLLISGGNGKNSLISIKGDIDLKQLSELSKTTGIEELQQLDNAEKKKPGK